MTWFGGRYKDSSHFFANWAVDTDQFFEVYPDVRVSVEQKRAFLEDPTGAIAGHALCERFSWKPGDRIFLKTTDWPFNVELTIRGIYDGGPDLGGALYFHWNYYNESMKAHNGGAWDNTGIFSVRVSSADELAPVSRQIDEQFHNGSFPTKSETEKAFMLSVVSLMGDVQSLITSVVSVVLLAILLVAAKPWPRLSGSALENLPS